MTYEDLLIEADDNNLIVKEKPLLANKGRIKGDRIAIKHDLLTNEKACVLAEELGHHFTTTGNIIKQSSESDIKQEERARRWAYEKQVGIPGLIKCFNMRCLNVSDMASTLGVTESFLNDSIKYLKNKYGTSVEYSDYIIVFEPYLYVIKRIH